VGLRSRIIDDRSELRARARAEELAGAPEDVRSPDRCCRPFTSSRADWALACSRMRTRKSINRFWSRPVNRVKSLIAEGYTGLSLSVVTVRGSTRDWFRGSLRNSHCYIVSCLYSSRNFVSASSRSFDTFGLKSVIRRRDAVKFNLILGPRLTPALADIKQADRWIWSEPAAWYPRRLICGVPIDHRSITSQCNNQLVANRRFYVSFAVLIKNKTSTAWKHRQMCEERIFCHITSLPIQRICEYAI